MSGILWLALLAMLVQQTFVTLGKTIVPVIGPAMTRAIGVEPEMVGIFVAIAGAASTVSAMASGRWIQRLGAMRVSQLSLLLVMAGLLMAAVEWLPIIALGAVVLGVGTVMATPASSEILARYAPPGRAALVFSLKQTGVPAGTMLAGLIGPLCVALLDWRFALLVVAGGTALLALLLQPLTARLEGDRGSRTVARVGMRETLQRTFADPAMRRLALAQAAYVGLQTIFTTFFVTFAVVRLGYDLATAGSLFAVAQLVAVFSRVFWGWFGSLVGGMTLLGLLGIAMSAIAGVLGLVTPAWPFWAVALVALSLASTAVSWHGVMLSEVAHRAPAGMVGAMTGGVIAFGSATGIVYPVAMTALLAATGNYALCFWLVALPPLAVAIVLLRSRD
jgi:nitrate/nitrite transporter NarK